MELTSLKVQCFVLSQPSKGLDPRVCPLFVAIDRGGEAKGGSLRSRHPCALLLVVPAAYMRLAHVKRIVFAMVRFHPRSYGIPRDDNLLFLELNELRYTPGASKLTPVRQPRKKARRRNARRFIFKPTVAVLYSVSRGPPKTRTALHIKGKFVCGIALNLRQLQMENSRFKSGALSRLQ